MSLNLLSSLGPFVKKHIWLILLLVTGVLLVRYLFFPPIPPAGTEILAKRTLTSRTFSNGDGTYRLEAFSHPIYFFDGKQYQPLTALAQPAINSREISILEKPDNLDLTQAFYQFFYESYEINPAAGVSLEEDGRRLVFRDAKKDPLFQFEPSEAVDAAGQEQDIHYQLIFENGKTSIVLKIPTVFLDQAAYPVKINLQPTPPL